MEKHEHRRETRAIHLANPGTDISQLLDAACKNSSESMHYYMRVQSLGTCCCFPAAGAAAAMSASTRSHPTAPMSSR
jgi:hypothetical protein